MWIFDKNGFTSVVGYKPSKDLLKTEHKTLAEESSDPDGWLLVRARIRADLEQIETELGIDIHILKDGGADYAYRALVTRAVWKQYLVAQVDAIDYDSHFKEVVRDNAPKHPQRYSAMMSVWSAMARLQDTKPYGGTDWGTGTGSSYRSGSTYGGGWTGSSVKGFVPRVDKDLVQKELDAEGDWGTVTVDDMVAALKEVGNDPKSVSDVTVEAATDDAFELWCAAFDSKEKLTDEKVDELAEAIKAEVDETESSVVAHAGTDEHAAYGFPDAEELAAAGADGWIESYDSESGDWVIAHVPETKDLSDSENGSRLNPTERG